MKASLHANRVVSETKRQMYKKNMGGSTILENDVAQSYQRKKTSTTNLLKQRTRMLRESTQRKPFSDFSLNDRMTFNWQGTQRVAGKIDCPQKGNNQLMQKKTINPALISFNGENLNQTQRTHNDSCNQDLSINEQNPISERTEFNQRNLFQQRKWNPGVGGKTSGLKKRSQVKKIVKRKKLRQKLQLESFLILPDDTFILVWDIIILLTLSYTTFITPYRIALIEEDNSGWIAMDTLVDCIFLTDLILNFFTAYYDENDDLVQNRKQIIKNYMKSWFTIDFISILPISYIYSGKDYASLARLARLPRLYRVIKLAKLVRLIKANSQAKNAYGLERIFILFFIFCIICHIVACLWIVIAKVDEPRHLTWIVRYGFSDLNNYETYIAALYWSVLSITVGFSDYTGTTTERFFQIIITLIGIIAVSFVIGSLTSVLYSIDSDQAELKEKLGILERIRKENIQLDDDLYMKVRKTLKYDFKKRDDEKVNFLRELPCQIRNDLAFIIFKNQISKFQFFRDKPKNFITQISQNLKAIKILHGEYLFCEGDLADNIYFITSGRASFVFPDLGEDRPFITVGEGTCLGELELQDMSLTMGRKRYFSVKALDGELELLSLGYKEILELKDEYKDYISELFAGSIKRIDAIKERIKITEDAILSEEEIPIIDYEMLIPEISDTYQIVENYKESDSLRIQKHFEQIENSMSSVIDTINVLHIAVFQQRENGVALNPKYQKEHSNCQKTNLSEIPKPKDTLTVDFFEVPKKNSRQNSYLQNPSRSNSIISEEFELSQNSSAKQTNSEEREKSITQEIEDLLPMNTLKRNETLKGNNFLQGHLGTVIESDEGDKTPFTPTLSLLESKEQDNNESP